MCGIAGYFCFGKKRPTKSILDNLLIESMSRGEDSTGVTFIEDGELKVYKASMDAKEFVEKNERWNALDDSNVPKYMAMHCRKSTRGALTNNMNNHPVFRDGMSVVHNGTIVNDDELYKQFGFKRDGEVDTEVILALIEQGREHADWSERAKAFDLLEGTFAIAAIDTALPDTMCFARHDRPLWFAVDKEDDILYFGSTKLILTKSIVRGYKNIVDISKSLVCWEMDNDDGMSIDKHGCTSKFTMSPAKPAPKRSATGSQVCNLCDAKASCYKHNKGQVYNSGWCQGFI